MRSHDTSESCREAAVVLCALGWGRLGSLVALRWQGTHGGRERAGHCLSAKA